MREILKELFSESAIIGTLVRMRLAKACRNHALHYYWSMSANPRMPDPSARNRGFGEGRLVDDLTIEDLVPGRRSWPRPHRKKRNAVSVEVLQRRALAGAMKRELDNPSCFAPWKSAFSRLFAEIEERMGDDSISFNAPNLHLLSKGDGKFRCLGSYSRMSDRIILGVVARYLRDSFDGGMRDESYAFRQNGQINHITAVRHLRDYRLRHLGEKLYVAECDIQSFFDVLNHDVVLAAYDTFAASVPEPVDPWFRRVVEAYLASYSSFRNVVQAEKSDDSRWGRISFRTSEELGKYLKKTYGTGDFTSLPIGIPQGGPLSPVLINLVMHRADMAVMSSQDPDLFYARFCDDMVIVHPDKKKCKEALDRYLLMMESLMLPCHRVQRGLRYGREFYAGKSKGPVAWCDCGIGTLRSTPWVSFLGEQIRFDGEVRVRLRSLEKQKERLLKEKAMLVRAIGKNGRLLKEGLDQDEVFASFRSRLVALGVGYVPTEQMGSAWDRCWMAAFPGVSNSRWGRTQMRELDRVRDRIIGSVGHGCLKAKSGSKSPERKFFAGRPFSYLGCLEREERPSKYALMDDMVAYGEW